MSYPGVLVYCANPACGHMDQVHHYGRRAGETVRTRCSDQTEVGYCPCELFVEPVLWPSEDVCVMCGQPKVRP